MYYYKPYRFSNVDLTWLDIIWHLFISILSISTMPSSIQLNCIGSVVRFCRWNWKNVALVCTEKQMDTCLEVACLAFVFVSKSFKGSQTISTPKARVSKVQGVCSMRIQLSGICRCFYQKALPAKPALRKGFSWHRAQWHPTSRLAFFKLTILHAKNNNPFIEKCDRTHELANAHHVKHFGKIIIIV